MNFPMSRHAQSLMIELPTQMGADASAEFKERFSGWVLEPVDFLVLDFAKTRVVEKSFYQVMTAAKNILKTNGKSLVSINVATALHNGFREAGLTQVFNPISDLDAHLRAHAPQPKPATSGPVALTPVLKLAQPFLKSTRKVFEVQLKTQAKALPPTKEALAMEQFAFISHVNLNSPKHHGRTSIFASRELALKVYQALFGEDGTPSDEELTDCLAELMNMIYGQAKTELNQSGFEFKPELPKVLTGTEVSHFRVSNRESLLLPFHTDLGDFFVEIYLTEDLPAAKAS